MVCPSPLGFLRSSSISIGWLFSRDLDDLDFCDEDFIGNVPDEDFIWPLPPSTFMCLWRSGALACGSLKGPVFAFKALWLFSCGVEREWVGRVVWVELGLCCVMVFLDEKWAWMVGKDKVSVDVRWNFYTGQWQVMQDSRNKAVVWKINKWKLVGLKKRTFQNSKKWAKYGSVGKTRKQINMHMNIHMSMQMKL